MSESAVCSSAMNYVPRMMPPGKQEFTYLKKEVRGIFLRHLKENKQHYVINNKKLDLFKQSIIDYIRHVDWNVTIDTCEDSVRGLLIPQINFFQ